MNGSDHISRQEAANGHSNPGTLSAKCSTSYAISQGAVVGPLSFPLYINDFHNSSKRFEIHFFADNANLFYKHEGLQQLQENINAELINIQTWLSAHKLSLNIEKSNFTPFHPPQKMSQDSSSNLNCMQQAIENRILY